MILRDRLAALHPGASRRQLKRWLEGSRVRVNGAVVRRGDVPVRPGDRVELAAPPPSAFPAPLAPIHEDAAILVVDKPAGLLTIATARERERTAYRLLMDYVAGGRPPGLLFHPGGARAGLPVRNSGRYRDVHWERVPGPAQHR